MSTPNKLAMLRSRLEVRETVIGTMIACSVSTNHTKRSRAARPERNSGCHSRARAGKIFMEWGLRSALNRGLVTLYSTASAALIPVLLINTESLHWAIVQ